MKKTEAIDRIHWIMEEMEQEMTMWRKRLALGHAALLGAAQGTWNPENVRRALLPLERYVKEITILEPSFEELVQAITRTDES